MAQCALLFPSGVRCSVSAGARLAFPPRSLNEAYADFEVEGVCFELKRSMIETTFADTFFGRALSFAATQNASVVRLDGHSAELFPIVCDFMVRRHADPQAVLRTQALTREQTRALDVLEDFLFPGLAPDRVFTDEARTHVLVALLPGYRRTFFGTYALNERSRGEADAEAFLFHEGLEGLCVDARFVRMVRACRVNAEVAQRLEEEYDLRKPISEAMLDACELVPVERGVPFWIESREYAGDQHQSVVEELPSWSVA